MKFTTVALCIYSGACSATTLSDAVHGILLRHYDLSIHEECSSFATDALASCGPGDLPCQCNQVSNVQSYCASLKGAQGSTLHPSTREYLEQTCKDVEMAPSSMSLIERILREDVTQGARNHVDLKYDSGHASANALKRAINDLTSSTVADELEVNSLVNTHGSAIIPTETLQAQLRPLIARLRKIISDEKAQLDASMNRKQESKGDHLDDLTSDALPMNGSVTKEKRDYVIQRVGCCETEEQRIELLQRVLDAAEILNASYPVLETTIIAELPPQGQDNSAPHIAVMEPVHVDAPPKIAPVTTTTSPTITADSHAVFKGHVELPLKIHRLNKPKKHVTSEFTNSTARDSTAANFTQTQFRTYGSSGSFTNKTKPMSSAIMASNIYTESSFQPSTRHGGSSGATKMSMSFIALLATWIVAA